MYGDDWDTTDWSVRMKFPFDYRYKVVGEAMKETIAAMKKHGRFRKLFSRVLAL